MDRSPPPFFKQGYSANARVIFFSLLAIALLFVDARTATLSAMRQGLGTVLYPLQRTLLIPRDALAIAEEYVAEVGRLRTENAELRRLETTNAKALLQAEQIALENARLREVLGARERIAIRSVVAEVRYDARDPFVRRIVIDKGLDQGLLPGQPVIDAKGVIGQVTRVLAWASEVTLLTDRNATIPIEIQRTGLRTVAFGGGAIGLMELRYLPTSADLKEGDLAVTSGLDGIFPPGLPVGRIKSVERAGSSAFARVLMEPVAGVDRSRLLLVLLVDKSSLPPPMPPEPVVEPRKRTRAKDG